MIDDKDFFPFFIFLKYPIHWLDDDKTIFLTFFKSIETEI